MGTENKMNEREPFDDNLLYTVDGELMNQVLKLLRALDIIEKGTKGVGWCCVLEAHEKKTKNNKSYYRMKITDSENNTAWLRVWGKFEDPPKAFSIWVAQVASDPQWGMSTSSYKMKQVTAYD